MKDIKHLRYFSVGGVAANTSVVSNRGKQKSPPG